MAKGSAAATQGWSNWSGLQKAWTARRASPSNEAELSALVKNAEGSIRVAGAGHSFTPIVAADTVVSMDAMKGVVSVDKARGQARIRCGSRLYDLSPALEAEGLAFRNLGDINVQSFAGAVSTATHGTGEQLSCLAAEICGLRIMLADGSVREASLGDDPDFVRAAQVSLGALGILLEADVQLQPAYRLHRHTWVEPIEQIIELAAQRWAQHRNYEFFYIPFSGYGINISHDETTGAETRREESRDEDGLANLKKLRDTLKWNTPLRRTLLGQALKRTPVENVIGTGWRLLSSVRETKFNESEYHIPESHGLRVLRDVIETIETKRKDVFFPVEVRKTAADSAWLSPFNDGPRISIAVHAHAPDDYGWFFEAAEPLFLAAGGRPHWGKLHSLKAEHLSSLYPEFSRFTALRRDMDPKGKFMSPALAALWGEA
jgi:FAD-linked oxidoreductase